MSNIEQKILDDYQDISDVEVVFGTTKLLAKRADIPEEFTFMGHSKWNKLFSDMFYCGLKELNITPKEGIDVNAALKCIKAHMGSFEPKHENKEIGVAYMMSILFEDATWTTPDSN